MDDESRFPTDETTLTLLDAACQINPDTGRTHLMDFLDMGTRIKDERDITEEVLGDSDIPVIEVTYEKDYAPYSPNHVIRDLIAEIRRLRSEVEEYG